jgi:hypothetical protein
MGGFVQQGGQDLAGAAGQALAADQDLGVVVVGVLPAAGGELAPLQPPPRPARGDHEHGLGDLGVAGPDRCPGVLQGGHQQARVPNRGHGWSGRRR